MLDSGAYSVWARSNSNPHRLELRRRVLEALKVHGSKKRAAEELGIPLGLVQTVSSDEVERRVTLENYAEFVSGHRHLFRGGVWNFDVIGSDKGSYENWLELRRLGVDTIPVHHVGDDVSYLTKYLDECEFVGIGAIAKMDTNSRIHGLDDVWKSHLLTGDGSPRCRVHGLGLTDTSIVLRYPWYSVDSTKTIAAAAYGSVLIPNLSRSEISYDDLIPVSISNQSRRVELPKGRSSSSSNFYFLPQRTQEVLYKLTADLGFGISRTLEGRVLRSKMTSRKRQDSVWVNGLGIEAAVEVQESEVSNNLSSSWRARYAFNLLMVDRFVEHWRQLGRAIRIYNVAGGSHVLDVFTSVSDSHPANRSLVSFAKMSDNLVTRLECAINGDTERSTIVGNQARTAGDGSEGTLRPVKQDRVRRREGGGVQRRRRNTASPSWRP